MSFKKAAALAFAMLACPVSAFAYDGSKSEQDACTPDVFSLCSAYIPNEKPIVACLESKKVQLSQACHQVMFPDVKPRRRRARTASRQ